jgi:hypothetical protein
MPLIIAVVRQTLNTCKVEVNGANAPLAQGQCVPHILATIRGEVGARARAIILQSARTLPL